MVGLGPAAGEDDVVKYDRPVWQIMHECADAMPDVFRYDDVRGWFVEHYPDVNEATIRAHLIGLTEGGRAKHVQFAARSPIFRRVARGEYSPVPLAERGEDPHGQAPSTSRIKMSGNGHHDEPPVPDIILLGSIGDRVNVPAPAKEVYREVGFQLSRLDAELSGSEWFVLSAEHGLLAPNEWVSPDSRTLADLDPSYRVAWASWVAARLQSMVGPLDGMIVRVDAPNAFVGPLFAVLQDAGAAVSSGSPDDEALEAAETAERAEHVDRIDRDTRSALVQAAAERLSVHAFGSDDTRSDDADHLATVSEITRRASVAHHLADVRQAVPATDVDRLPSSPGLYGWIVDPIGARVLNRCLRLPVRPGVVFVGQVGGSSWHSLVDPVHNLRDHLDRVQLHGRTRASTFRMTLATVLGDYLGMASLEDPRLTTWMLEHLSITTWAVEGGDDLRELAGLVVDELDPPLNVDHLASTEYRARLQQMRGELA